MRIHAIQTGTVRVHERQRSGSGRGPWRFLKTLLDTTWTAPLPIHAWVIEHPEGVILIDTGETARAAEPGYFPRWHPYFRFGLTERVDPEAEIGPALRGLGIGPEDVRWVVMTHLHTDHAGGLGHVAGSEVLVSAEEYEDARGFMGKVRGYLPQHWPRDFSPTLVRFPSEPFGPFPESHPLTGAGDVRLVPTPGHTRGHLSVAVELGDVVLFFAGDASYTEANLHAGIVDGVASMGAGEDAAARTLARIRTLGETRPLVYLPSHDPGSEQRLRQALEGADRRARSVRPSAPGVRSSAFP